MRHILTGAAVLALATPALAQTTPPSEHSACNSSASCCHVMYRPGNGQEARRCC
jgi:hypothetical protein